MLLHLHFTTNADFKPFFAIPTNIQCKKYLPCCSAASLICQLVSPAQLYINCLKESKYKHLIAKLSPIISLPKQESGHIINDHSYAPYISPKIYVGVKIQPPKWIVSFTLNWINKWTNFNAVSRNTFRNIPKYREERKNSSSKYEWKIPQWSVCDSSESFWR